MKTISTTILLLVLLAVSLTGWRVFSQSNSYAIGGECVIHTGDVVHGDLRAFFAQVTVQDGARVDGSITAISSTLDLAGSVGGSVLAVESDLAVRDTAKLSESPRRVEGIPYVLLLPHIVRTGYTASISK
jgi:hypothetical protein